MIDIYMNGAEVHAETPEEEREASLILNAALSGKTTPADGCICPAQRDSTVGKGFSMRFCDGTDAVLMHHLVQQGGSGLLNGTVKGSRRNIDLVLVLAACLPDLGTGDMTIGGRGLFQADDGFGQLACKVVLVELAEHLFQLTSSAGGFDSLFHDFSNLSLDKKGRDRYNIGVARPGGCVGLCTAQTLDGRRYMGLFLGDVR